MTDKKLRIQAVSIHVSLAWDDGDELTAGTEIQPVTLPLSQARQMLEGLSAEVAQLEKKLREQESAESQENAHPEDCPGTPVVDEAFDTLPPGYTWKCSRCGRRLELPPGYTPEMLRPSDA